MKRRTLKITGTSPATPSTAIIGSIVGGLSVYDWFTIDASLVGATGGTLDVYLQRQVALAEEVSGGVWVDWLHYAQLADGASAVVYSCQTGTDTTIRTVGAFSTDASVGTPVLAANTFAGGHPGHAIRCVGVAGADTTVGAAVTIYLGCFDNA